MAGGEPTRPAVSLAEAQAFLRLESGDEEALLAAMLLSATAMCEAFTGQVLVARPFAERLPATGEWQRLAVTPVRSIDAVGAHGTTLPATAYAVDIDAAGDGWVRLSKAVEARVVTVSGEAGMASDANGVPEPLRHGILRLAAHLFAARDGDGGEPPAAVTALWRPYRRIRLAGPTTPTVAGWRLA